MLELTINRRTRRVDVEPDMPLLWVLRDHLDLPGTKYGCGISICGACTVLVDGAAVRSCALPVSAAGGKKIVTIEGLSQDGLHRVQQAWVEHEVPQCGYCQTGMIMAVVALLAKNSKPTDADIEQTITNLCRCGTYARVRKAIHALAEELDCDWGKVGTEFASPNEHVRRNRIWGSMSTGGSMGVRSSQDYVRKAGASAREMLIMAAAAQWKVPASECTVEQGVISHVPTGRKLRYGQVAAEAATLAPPKEVRLRDPKDWKIAGKPMHRLDIPDKVLGKPVFAVDVMLPGMLHASIAQCPVFGGKLVRVDARAARNMRGVKKIVREESFVAVVADSWWRANEALKKLSIEWDVGDHGKASNETIAAMLRAGLTEGKLPQARKLGDVETAIAGAAKVIVAEYQSPYLNHATMEPQTCTAWLKPEGFLEVWTSTQDAEASLAAAAATAGLPLEKVEVHKMMLGGGFGCRGGPQDFVRQGVRIAMAMPDTPVKLMWSREEDMQHGFYRPASVVRMKAGLDAKGNLVALHTKIACPSILEVLLPRLLGRDGVDFTAVRFFSDLCYTVPNQRVEYAKRNGHV